VLVNKVAQYEDDETFEDVDGTVYWGSRASGVLFVRNHPTFGWQLLVTLRSRHVDYEPNTWGVTGGAIPEYEDDSFMSAMRETTEEIGSVPHNYRLIDEYTWQAPNGTFTYTTYIVEVLDLSWEDYRFNWEVSDAMWVTLENAQQLDLHPGFSEMISTMGTRIFGEQG
jgi:8-oxo-dGTP pyrophosphatase MutT (NUDIX family)